MNNKNMHVPSCFRSGVGISLVAALLITTPAMADTVRSAIARSAWAQLDAARAAQNAAKTQIQAAQLARDGKLVEQAVRLVTTLDVLNAQQDVPAARLAAIGSEHDLILASFTLLAATDHQQTTTLVLPVESYEPVFTTMRSIASGSVPERTLLPGVDANASLLLLMSFTTS